MVEPAHESMVPPPGYTFIFTNKCAVPGCFQCTKIHCDKCDIKDRRNLELEKKNAELVHYIERLQHRLIAKSSGAGVSGQYGLAERLNSRQENAETSTAVGKIIDGPPPAQELDLAFAYIRSPLLFDPKMNRMYRALTLFLPPEGELL